MYMYQFACMIFVCYSRYNVCYASLHFTLILTIAQYMPLLCTYPGEEVYTQLYGTAINVNVTLDRSSLVLDDTYLSLSSQRSVIIHNRSDVVVHYQWKAFASELEEDFRRQT